jgi:sugar phosphate isomerase/epimerase
MFNAAVDRRQNTRAAARRAGHEVAVSLVKCEVCRSYYHDVDDHPCPGLRSVDWVRFMRALREWMTSDPYARFEVFYARRRHAPGDP